MICQHWQDKWMIWRPLLGFWSELDIFLQKKVLSPAVDYYNAGKDSFGRYRGELKRIKLLCASEPFVASTESLLTLNLFCQGYPRKFNIETFSCFQKT